MQKTGVSMARWRSAVPLAVAALMAAACSSAGSAGSATAAYTSTNPVRAGTVSARASTNPTRAGATSVQGSTAPAQTTTAPAQTSTAPSQTGAVGASPTASSRAATVKLGAGSSTFGTYITGAGGRAVYMFGKDTKGTSFCFGACTAVWPPVLTSSMPTAGAGLKASLLGATMRLDGRIQVTYAGFPLYYHTGDTKPGEVSGEGSQAFGAGWYLVSPSGHKLVKPGP